MNFDSFFFFINYVFLTIRFAKNVCKLILMHLLISNCNFILFRPEDPPEYNVLYLIPASVFFGGYTWGIMNDLSEIHNFASLGSSLCCVGAIASLSSQKTARFGNNLGIVSIL